MSVRSLLATIQGILLPFKLVSLAFSLLWLHFSGTSCLFASPGSLGPVRMFSVVKEEYQLGRHHWVMETVALLAQAAWQDRMEGFIGLHFP